MRKGFAKGRKKTGGRKVGVANKLGSPIKDAIASAFHKVGGEAYLIKLSKGTTQDRAMFCRLVEKLVPAELKIDPESQLNLVVLRDYTGEHDGRT